MLALDGFMNRVTSPEHTRIRAGRAYTDNERARVSVAILTYPVNPILKVLLKQLQALDPKH